MVSTVTKEDDGAGADDDADSVFTDEDANDLHTSHKSHRSRSLPSRKQSDNYYNSDDMDFEVRIENGLSRASSHQSGLSDTGLEKSDTGDDVQTKEKLSVFQLFKSHKAILFSLAVSNLVCFMCLALMAPFYPKEANSRGVSTAISGWVFGVFSLVQFLTSPIFGRLIPKAGARFLLIGGLFFGGGCSVLMGCLDMLPPTSNSKVVFIVLSVVLRVFLSLGCSANSTALFVICAQSFPDNAAMVLGMLEMFTGIGLMVGPAIGGLLYDLGGFMLPFMAVGGLMMFLSVIFIFIFPASQEYCNDGESLPMTRLLQEPTVLLVLLSVTACSMIWVALDPTLEPHLRQFNLSATIVGLIFLMLATSYAMFSPLWGWLADKMSNSTPLLVIGFYVSAGLMLLLGPSPLFGFEDYQRLWLKLIILPAMGMSISLSLVPTFDKALDATQKCGVEINLASHSAVGGLWMSACALGEFIGPTAAGVMVDQIGFSWAMTGIAGSCAVMGTVMFFYWLYESRCCVSKSSKLVLGKESDTERSPLIHPQTVEPYYSDTEPGRRHARRGSTSSSYYGYVARSQPNKHITRSISRLNQDRPVYNRSQSTPDINRTISGSGGYTSM